MPTEEELLKSREAYIKHATGTGSYSTGVLECFIKGQKLQVTMKNGFPALSIDVNLLANVENEEKLLNYNNERRHGIEWAAYNFVIDVMLGHCFNLKEQFKEQLSIEQDGEDLYWVVLENEKVKEALTHLHTINIEKFVEDVEGPDGSELSPKFYKRESMLFEAEDGIRTWTELALKMKEKYTDLPALFNTKLEELIEEEEAARG